MSRTVTDARLASGLFCLVLPLLFTGSLPAFETAGSLSLELTAANQPGVFVSDNGFLPVPPGMTAVYGRLEHPDFAVDGLDEIILVGPGSEIIPLVIETGTLFLEFDQVVGMNFAFLVPAAEAEPGRIFTLRWESGAGASNRAVERLSFSPDAAGTVLSFRVGSPGAPDDEMIVPVTSIQVIADSSADYHFLWYLLPMAVLFAILTIRKIRADHLPG